MTFNVMRNLRPNVALSFDPPFARWRGLGGGHDISW